MLNAGRLPITEFIVGNELRLSRRQLTAWLDQTTGTQRTQPPTRSSDSAHSTATNSTYDLHRRQITSRRKGWGSFGCGAGWLTVDMTAAAGLIFVNGSVVTVDPDSSVAEALAVGQGVILAVGSRAEVEALAGPATRVVDLAGGCVLPGINDSHIHAVSLGYMTPPMSLDVAFPTVRSIADVVESVRLAAASKAPGEWILGSGWDLGFLQECLDDQTRRPTRQDLDAVAPHNPVFLQDFSYHAGWVNTAALRLADIDPEGDHAHDETVPSDAAGQPTGVLYERAQRMVLDQVPPMTDEQRRRAILIAQGHLNALGVTSITDPALGLADPVAAMGAGGLDAYRSLHASGELTMRVNALRFPSGMAPSYEEFATNLALEENQPTTDPRRFQVVGTKIFADGIPPNKSAWMYDEYVGGGLGALTVAGETDDERVINLNKMIALAHDAGHQIGVHVTGDRSADVVIDAFVEAVTANPRPDPRHYVIHADFLTPRAIATCAEYGFGASMNPAIKWMIADFATEIVGPERSAYEWPYRDAIDAGVKVASASDAPVTFPDWRQGLSTMLLRESKATGTVSGPEQCITLMEALRTYTINAAWQDRAEDWKGSLEVGKVADLCVLGGDLLTMDAHDMPTVPVLMTVLDGAVIFESDGSTESSTTLAGGPVAGHYGPSTRLAILPAVCGCEYDSLDLR